MNNKEHLTQILSSLPEEGIDSVIVALCMNHSILSEMDEESLQENEKQRMGTIGNILAEMGISYFEDDEGGMYWTQDTDNTEKDEDLEAPDFDKPTDV